MRFDEKKILQIIQAEMRKLTPLQPITLEHLANVLDLTPRYGHALFAAMRDGNLVSINRIACKLKIPLEYDCDTLRIMEDGIATLKGKRQSYTIDLDDWLPLAQPPRYTRSVPSHEE